MVYLLYFKYTCSQLFFAVYNPHNQTNGELTNESLSLEKDKFYHHKLAYKIPYKRDRLSNDIPLKYIILFNFQRLYDGTKIAPKFSFAYTLKASKAFK
jgi:hypothetical protein